ncbi:unnamed protein product [Durusdinium trenchii]|uniref:Calpain catalytic domain-containing protein n=1 Tax=Durusdinium trenchii TaxID=1381693 RepID=A0ABP0RWH9_9DINO
MSALIEEASSSLSPEDALKNFCVLQRILSNVIANPGEGKYRTLNKSKLEGKLSPIGLQILQALGFADMGEALVLSSRDPGEDFLQAKELLDCLTMSADGEAGDVAVDAEDAELAEALRLSMDDGVDAAPTKRARPSEEEERALAERLERDEPDERTEVSFERFRAEDVQIELDAVEKINQFCKETGDKYVDPQFPPTSKSLYLSAEDAETWQCLGCKRHSPLPPTPPLPKSQEEAKQQEADFAEKAKCVGCGEPAHYAIKVHFFSRPTQWLRPGERCLGCELLYSHLPAGKELLPRLCPHFLRDSMSNTTVGAPWKLIRGEARTEDVCQGGLGNCWFAGALSVVATCPKMVEKLFETKDFNPNGAYLLKLHHAGSWRRILIDDLLPTSQIFEGYIDGQTIYYSRGGTLCYLQGSRRQLWVPLVEKAAAKLFGNWAGLKGGTFGEALGLFTGFPTQRLMLYLPKELRRRREERRKQIADERTMMLLRGLEVPDMEDSDDDIENDDIKWSTILSARECGYLMGMGCTEEGCEKTKHHIVEEMGLQAPHAYGILDAQEIEVDGRLLRMMKIRNPWGERAPRTWKGPWGKDSDKWTPELKYRLGVVNSSNVELEDPMSVFWMDYNDVKEYFGAEEICRVHEGWCESRTQVWLPSGVGPGQGVDVTVFRRTAVDICIWQEKHIAREAALHAKATNIDVGFAVLRKLGVSEGKVQYDLIEIVKRARTDDVSSEMILEGGYVYRIVPVSYGMSQEFTPRRAVVAVHSVQAVETERVSLDWSDTATAVIEGTRKRGKKRPIQQAAQGVSCWLLQEEAGMSFVAENSSDFQTALQVDASDSIGCVASRESFDAVIALPPHSRQVLIGVAYARGAIRCGTAIQAVGLPGDAANFALRGEGLHMDLPISKPAVPAPDQSILDRAPPEKPDLQRNITRGSSMSQDDMATLQAAMELSMQAKEEDKTEVEDDLAMAIKLSMDCKAAPLAAAPAPADDKATLQARVKALFEQYRSSGMPPNEAAAKALAHAQTLSTSHG